MSLNTPIIIDIEASGFGASSYPIEIGLAMDTGQRHSMLLRPAPGWTHWDDSAEALHGISRSTLMQHGRPVQDVAMELNALVSGKVAYSDGWVVDKPWMTLLFHTARVTMQFRLSPVEQLLSEPQIERWDAIKCRLLDEFPATRHRASYDAWIIQQTCLRTRTPVDQ